MKDNVFTKVDEIMLKQLEILDKTSVDDKDFNKKKEKAKTITLVADKLIQSQVAQLKNDIWEHSRALYAKRDKVVQNSSFIEIEQEDVDLLENEK